MTSLSNQAEKSILDRPLLNNLAINWELLLYIVIFLFAFGTRFYDLGTRVMSHDESLHALYSFKLYDGEGYRHDPLMHGPLQFHLVALSYLIFGDNDFSARIPAALFGVALVILPYWFRPWLGRVGALVTSFGLLISPMLLYYQRYIRNEAYLTFLMALMVLCLFQYMRHRHVRWLYIGAMAVSLSLAVKAVGYINGFIGVLFLVTMFMWENIPRQTFRQVLSFSGVFILVLLGLEMGLIAMASEESSAVEASRLWGLLPMLMGLLIAMLAVARDADRENMPITKTLYSFSDPTRALKLLAGPIIASLVVFFLLYTTFLTNPNGFVSSVWGTLSYWLSQHGVNRGSQPGYYYLMLMPLYEFLPFIIALVGGIIYVIKGAPTHLADPEPNDSAEESDQPDEAKPSIYPSDGGSFAAFLIMWCIAAFAIYSWAGEKMPWLTSHITLPFIFLMGHVSQTVLGKFSWSSLKQRDGLIFALLTPLFGAVTFVVITSQPFQGQRMADIANTSRFMIAVLILIAIAYGLWVYGRRLGKKLINPIIYLSLFSVMAILTIRFAWLSSFVNYDYVNEFMVYAHGAPDVKWVLDEVDEISRRTVGDNQIKVAYAGVIWPMEWYMRNYPNRAFFKTPSRDVLDAPVVILSPDPDISLEEVEPYLGDDYERYRYRQVWWPVETYKNQTFTSVFHDYIYPSADSLAEDPWAEIGDNWQNLWNIFFYRKHERHTLSEWPYVTRMYFYVRKDIQAQMWDMSSGGAALAPPVPDPLLNLEQNRNAISFWGSTGSAEGQFSAPHAVAVSAFDQVYVADSGNRRIQIFDQNGNFLKSWTYDGWQNLDQSQLFELWGLAVSDSGRVYVSDTWNHRVLIFDEDGNYQSEFGGFGTTEGDPSLVPGKFWGPREIAIDQQGFVYVADTGNKRIQKFDPEGNHVDTLGGGGVLPGKFEEPVGLAFDQTGNLYVADTWNQRIQKFDQALQPLLEWDVTAWDSENASNKPYITVDTEDRVFISDPENYRVIVYDGNTGQPLGTFGQFGQELNAFRLPLDLVSLPDNSLLVVDHANNRIMKFSYP